MKIILDKRNTMCYYINEKTDETIKKHVHLLLEEACNHHLAGGVGGRPPETPAREYMKDFKQ